jgi:phosphohistidine phosphatase
MLWLLRHGEAADGQVDAERPLTDRGLRQADAAGQALARLGVDVDVCLTSPKVRAVQTAERACDLLGIEITIEPGLSGEPFDASALTVGLGNVLLVGHNPSFAVAVHALTGAHARLRKGGLAGISDGELELLLRPAELVAIASAAVPTR